MIDGETCAFSQSYDYGFSLKSVISQMGKDIPVFMFTDAKSIFDTITKSRYLGALRLMNDIADIRRAFRQNEINHVDEAKRKSDP